MSSDKKGAYESTQPLESHEGERAFADPQWQTGFFERFPWLGFGALCTVLLCAASAVIVLLLSDGKSQSVWHEKIAPNVILSGLNSVSNICFGVAIGNGVAIAWWRKTLKGSTISDLHRSWSFSSSFKDLVLSGTHFNFIALAALTAKLTIIDSMLLQRSTTTIVAMDQGRNHTHVFGQHNDTIPYTAKITTRSGTATNLDHWFNTNMNYWIQYGGAYPLNYLGCTGLCLLDIPGAGFEFDCISNETSVDYGKDAAALALALSTSGSTTSSTSETPTSETSTSETSTATSDTAASESSVSATSKLRRRQTSTSDNSTSDTTATTTNSTDGTTNVFSLFNVDFQNVIWLGMYEGDAPSANGINSSTLTMNVLSVKQTDADKENATGSCPGTVIQHTCTLRPAIVRYPVTIQNYYDINNENAQHTVSGMTLGYNTSAADRLGDAVSKYDPAQKQQDGFVVLGYKDIQPQDFLSGPSQLAGLQLAFNTQFGGSSSLTFDGIKGYLANQVGKAQSRLTESPEDTFMCGFAYEDPLNNIIQQINSIMFTLAIDPFGLSDIEFPRSNFTATEFQDNVHYKTKRPYMYGAIASILFCVACVLPSYYGFWQLGRDVTLGPFEIANAFRAPVLDHPDAANAVVGDLIKEVGDRKVKYGEMVTSEAPGRLAIAEPESVRRVHPSIASAKQDIGGRVDRVLNRT